MKKQTNGSFEMINRDELRSLKGGGKATAGPIECMIAICDDGWGCDGRYCSCIDGVCRTRR